MNIPIIPHVLMKFLQREMQIDNRKILKQNRHRLTTDDQFLKKFTFCEIHLSVAKFQNDVYNLV